MGAQTGGLDGNLAIAGVVDEEARKEFIKIDNPNMTKIRKAADTYEKEANSNKARSDTSKKKPSKKPK